MERMGSGCGRPPPVLISLLFVRAARGILRADGDSVRVDLAARGCGLARQGLSRRREFTLKISESTQKSKGLILSLRVRLFTVWV